MKKEAVVYSQKILLVHRQTQRLLANNSYSHQI
jgi:hypothetical protein